ncbi:hypothetical protein SAMN02746098_04505 [Desulfosporosinus lacus DSM 15449]|uniref:Uncharacterized protein n=1 Tax=Desulfosporosinus lacus DSM 15449 TaxID=1121420 RepID=A0A1M6DCC8_9FIRM|nr:hypothetical protein SAMN02746098_04505 [Desulfosporosinus lacus DSM 15449]
MAPNAGQMPDCTRKLLGFVLAEKFERENGYVLPMCSKLIETRCKKW